MSGVSIIGIATGGLVLAGGLGTLLALDPAEAAARNERIRQLTAKRRDRRAALEKAARCAADERERLAQTFVTARVDAAGAAAALAAVGLPPDPVLVPPPAGPAVERWCREVPAAVRAAQERARDAAAHLAVRRLRTLLPDPGALPLVDAADLAGPGSPGGTPTRPAEVTVVLTRMLATLHARASDEDRALVEAAAEAVTHRQDRAAHLAQLRLCIQEANDRVERQRVDAVTAGQLLDAMEPYSPVHGLDPDLLGGARAALAEVVAGRRALDDTLLDLVADLRERVEARASAAVVSDAVADVLEDLGYQVGPDFSVGEAAAGRLEISHPAQPDHLVRMRVDAEERRLVALVYRTGAGGALEEADTTAEAAWCGALDKAIKRLAGDGMVLTPVLLTAPGSRLTPVIDADRSTGHAVEQRRHRTNDRTER